MEVVSDDKESQQYKLKLRCRDEAKGAVTAICGMNGYLVSSMGQKVCIVHYHVSELHIHNELLDLCSGL